MALWRLEIDQEFELIDVGFCGTLSVIEQGAHSLFVSYLCSVFLLILIGGFACLQNSII